MDAILISLGQKKSAVSRDSPGQYLPLFLSFFLSIPLFSRYTRYTHIYLPHTNTSFVPTTAAAAQAKPGEERERGGGGGGVHYKSFFSLRRDLPLLKSFLTSAHPSAGRVSLFCAPAHKRVTLPPPKKSFFPPATFYGPPFVSPLPKSLAPAGQSGEKVLLPDIDGWIPDCRS